ncbi:DUF559 domain-containing protein [Mammaliicoccus sp. E-M26]|uniref:DUF559 domain-containing protein n=1 Tax=Mammaliicoccus sp. E-M26 TaxID=2898686 RepID=UPI001EFBFEC0|nr:DUF559 domain-containing protein [Mammaliicoccus sp. E-M26]
MEKVKTCWHCGRLGTARTGILKNNINNRYFHDDCFKEFQKEKDERLNRYVELKIMVMHERALRLLEKQNADLEMYYDESAAVLEKALEEPNKFLSSHEMIVAMELLRNEVRFKKEYKVLTHKVDFLIPEYKIVLEVDGHTHKYQKVADTKRDGNILTELNRQDDGWEVVRIPTKRVEENIAKLMEAIVTIKKHKQELRRNNNGFIPANFSKRDKEFYEEQMIK